VKFASISLNYLVIIYWECARETSVERKEVISVKVIRIFLLSVISVIVVASVALAAGEKKKETVPSALPMAAKVQQITGDVKSVSYSAMSITVAKKCNNKILDTVVAVDNKTKISMDGKKGTFDDLKTGDRVVVRYTEVKGRNVAEAISIRPSKKESAEKETEKKVKPAKK
jgi:hypothetical protein